MNVNSLREEMWPLAYEANIKGWVKGIRDYVSNDLTFGFLKANNVSSCDTNKVNTHKPSKRTHFNCAYG